MCFVLNILKKKSLIIISYVVCVTVTFQINTPNTTAHRITTNICV